MSDILTEIRKLARKIRAGEGARMARDALYEQARGEGESFADIADAAGVSVNAVKFTLASRKRQRA